MTAITFWLVTLPVTGHCPLAYCVVTQSLCVIVEWPGLQPMPNYHITPFCQDVFYCYLIFIIVVDCENRTCSISCLEVVTGILNHRLIFLCCGRFLMCVLFMFNVCVMFCFVSLFLVVSTSAVSCLERLLSEMTYYIYLSNGRLNPTHSLTLLSVISFV